jgi:flagellar assembly protein FliH
MKSYDRRVIKSEEVKFLHSPDGIASSLGRLLGDEFLLLDGFDLERVKEAFTRKIKLVQQEFYDKGLSDGIKKGRQLQTQETRQGLNAMAVIVKEVSSLKRDILQNAEEHVIQLSLAVAAKVIHLEVKTNREVVRSVLADAIRGIGDRENMKIRIHPQDFHFMMEIKADFLKDYDGISNILFEQDESISRGGAVIETLCGEVDARLDQQYNEIKKVMRP